MPQTVEQLEGTEIIRVVSSGHTSIEEWNNSLDRVMKINAQTGITGVLIDTGLQASSPNTLHLFDFAAGLPAGLKFAIVVGAATRNDFDFLATVGVNRGKSIHIFEDYTSALEWLVARP